jgi:hypothetical protein
MDDRNTISDQTPVPDRDETSRADPRQRRRDAKLTQIVAEA